MVLVSLFLILLIGGEHEPGQQEWTPYHVGRALSCLIKFSMCL